MVPLRLRWSAALGLVLLLAACATPTQGATPPIGGARPVKVITPQGYSQDKPAPLLLLLHGYGSSPEGVGAFLRLAPLAAKAGIIFAAPEGLKDKDGKPFWNASPACCDMDGRNVDDSAYLAAVINDIAEDYAVDRRRVFVVGHSNGGFMAHRMACDHSAEIAAIVSAAGAGFADAKACKPASPVAVLQIQGDADPIVSYDGGELSAPYPGAEQTVRDWAERDGCDPAVVKGDPIDLAERAEVSVADSASLPGPETATMSYGKCRPGGYAALWRVGGGGHSPALAAGGAQHILDFLLAHPKP